MESLKGTLGGKPELDNTGNNTGRTTTGRLTGEGKHVASRSQEGVL